MNIFQPKLKNWQYLFLYFYYMFRNSKRKRKEKKKEPLGPNIILKGTNLKPLRTKSSPPTLLLHILHGTFPQYKKAFAFFENLRSFHSITRSRVFSRARSSHISNILITFPATYSVLNGVSRTNS